METLAGVDLEIKQTPLPPPEGRREWTLQGRLSVEAREGEATFVVSIGDKEYYAAPLREIIGQDEWLNHLPGWVYGAGDPVTGCLVRAGLTSSARQIQACYLAAEAHERITDRIRVTCRCLMEKVPDIAFTTALRTGICIAGGGQ